MATRKKLDQPLKILFCASEVFPLIKTGGLADVGGGLPVALSAMGHDITIVLPGYPRAIQTLKHAKSIAYLTAWNGQILQGHLPNTKTNVWLIDIPHLFNRDGGPYQDSTGHDWPDNANRFYEFNRVCVEIAMNRLDLNSHADVVHCNDWQTGLVPALLSLEQQRPATVFTIHNLAYQGVFSWNIFNALKLPPEFWTMEKLEYYGQFSFLKGGIVFSDAINTVSATYAKEILTPQLGFGMDGLLKYRSDVLSGILNGVDYEQWNPATDKFIPQSYSTRSLQRKAVNKAALQKRFGLPESANTPLIGTIGRMVEQKGYDLVLDALPKLMKNDLQMVMLGSGHASLEQALAQSPHKYPGKCAVQIGYDEELAHFIEAGADLFLMPSRFEPCGLNQIYSLKYGTVPIVHRTGGLADSVVDTTDDTIAKKTATGFHFAEATPQSLIDAVDRALQAYRQPETWQQLIKTGMKCDFGWPKAAQNYVDLYQKAFKIHANTNNNNN